MTTSEVYLIKTFIGVTLWILIIVFCGLCKYYTILNTTILHTNILFTLKFKIQIGE